MRFVLTICLLVVGSFSAFGQVSSSEKAPSATELLTAIEASMKQFEQCSFEASSLESRVVPGNAEADPIMGKVEWSIVSDGVRWKSAEKNFRVARSKKGVTVKDVVKGAGYDGRDYWHVDDGTLYIGEKEFAIVRLAPKEIFWNVGSSPGWLTAILKKYDPEITSIQVANRPCWRVVSTVRDRHYDIVLSPTQSWLPLSTTIKVNGKVHTHEKLHDLKETAEGCWYPTLIEFTSPGAMFGVRQSRIQVAKFSTAVAGLDDSDFAFKPEMDQQVVDYGRGLVWKNGPWWSDLDEFLHREVGFPRKNPGCFFNLKTVATKPEVEGKVAPPLRVRKWLNIGKDVAEPTAWSDRPEGITTILYFFSGSASSPSSRKIHGLRSLKRHYPNAPVQLIGIASSDADEEEVRRTIETLHIDFPVAIDAKDRRNAGNPSGDGQCHTAFGMRAGVVLVNSTQNVQFVTADPIKAFTNLGRFGTTNPTDPVEPLPDYRTNRAENDRINQRWLELVKDAPANGSIAGKVVFVQGAATDRFDADPGGQDVGVIVDIKLTPRLEVNTYNGWGAVDAFVDNSRVQYAQTELSGEFKFTGLAKGRYELAIDPAFGLAKSTREFTVPTGESNVNVGEIRLQQMAEIVGVVVDESGQHIPNAKIVAVARHFDPQNPDRETNANLPAAQTTDETGNFHFRGLHIGAYSFVVSADGFAEARQEPVAAGSQNVSFQLSRE